METVNEIIRKQCLEVANNPETSDENRLRVMLRAVCEHEWVAEASHTVNIDVCKKCGAVCIS